MKKLCALPLIALALFAQSAKKPTFDVVSIKPNNSGQAAWPYRVAAGRFSASNIPLRNLIAMAYGDPDVRLYLSTEITGLPDWANTARYDVEAHPEPGFLPTTQQRQEMLQAMLEDRFKLKVRREPKDRPIYALVVDRGGVKMKLSADQTPFDPSVPPPPGASPSPRPAIPAPGTGLVNSPRAKMELIATVLGIHAGRKVIDRTGLTGVYDVELRFAYDSMQLPPGVEVDPNIPNLFTALREQLGLRLVPDSGPVDTFVVESIQRPTEN